MNNLSYWPFSTEPRPNQIKALEWLEAQEARYLILESPVGSGKSFLALAYSHYLTSKGDRHDDEGNILPKGGNSYILTPQRILQKQYENDFLPMKDISIASFYGKGNYPCNEKNATCDIGGLVNPECKRCPFKIAKQAAKAAKNTVLNYKLALLMFGFGTSLKRRNLIVFDEAHTLESQLIEFDALKITEWRCKQLKIPFKVQKTIPKALEWMRDVYLPEITEVFRAMEIECEVIKDNASKGVKLKPNELKKLREFESLADHVDEVAIMSTRDPNYIDEHFVLVHEPIAFQFKRLYGAYTFNRLIKPMADKFLFMSSTILNKDGFCKDLGIDPKETAFLSLDSDFPPENRPVYYIPTSKMNAKWSNPENEQGRTQMLNAFEHVLKIHKDDTGIIHTGNFAIAKWIVENYTGLEYDVLSHKIYHHNPDSGDDRNSIIEAFQNETKPSILISPSSTEGLDLKEDLARFAIFVKCPFANLSDQWIKKRMELSSEWYQRQALINIIQGGGRIVRSKDDWGKVYILDASFGYLYKSTFQMIPKWWRDAYQII
jgi:ATP-dependent DNA helicase DinG